MPAVVGNATTGRPSHNPNGRPSNQRAEYRRVACPDCGARVGETCKRKDGTRAHHPHANRRDRAKARPEPNWWGREAEMLPTPAVVVEWDSMAPPNAALIGKAAARTAQRIWTDHITTVREATEIPLLIDYATGRPSGKVYRVILREKG